MERKRIEKMKEMARKVQENFKSFYLNGGTALMFKYMHRISEDLGFLSYKPFSFLRLSSKMRKKFNIKKEENFDDIKIASDYDIFLNKLYAAGRRIENKDAFDFAFLYQKYKWNKNKIKKDFEKKFLNQSFEIYLGAIFSIEDYRDLDKNTIQIIEKIKRDWIE